MKKFETWEIATLVYLQHFKNPGKSTFGKMFWSLQCIWWRHQEMWALGDKIILSIYGYILLEVDFEQEVFAKCTIFNVGV